MATWRAGYSRLRRCPTPLQPCSTENYRQKRRVAAVGRLWYAEGGRLPVAAGQGALTSAGGAALTPVGAVGGCQIERAAEVRLGTSDPCITLPDELALAMATDAGAPAQPDTRKNRANPPKYGGGLRFNTLCKIASVFPCKYKMRKDVVSISVKQNEMFAGGHCGGHYRYSSPQHVRAFTIPQFWRPVARDKARDLARCGRARLA